MAASIDDRFVTLLGEIESRLRSAGDPIVDQLGPGLSPTDVAALTAGLGVCLPIEAQLWWQWHDGVRDDRARKFFRIGWPLPLNAAVQLCHEWRARRELEAAQLFAELELDPTEAVYWDDAWFPVFQTGHNTLVVVDCSVAPPEPTPVREVLDVDPHFASPAPAALSLSEVLEAWITVVDRGWCRYDAKSALWDWTIDWAAMPDLLRQHLVA